MAKSATSPAVPASMKHGDLLQRFGKKYQLALVPSVTVDSSESPGRGGAKKFGRKGPRPKLVR